MEIFIWKKEKMIREYISEWKYWDTPDFIIIEKDSLIKWDVKVSEIKNKLKEQNITSSELIIQKNIKEELLERIKDQSYVIQRNLKELENICSEYNLLLFDEVLSKSRKKHIQEWRAKCMNYLYNIWYTYETIAKAFNRNHTAVMYLINKYCKSQ